MEFSRSGYASIIKKYLGIQADRLCSAGRDSAVPQPDREIGAAGSILEFVQQPEAQRFFGRLHDNLLIKWDEHDTRVILICAATTGEGASTVALGLALAAARNKQEKILLVDGNPHQSGLGQVWQARSEPNLADYLTGRVALETIPQQTQIDNLWGMAVGQEFGSQTQTVATMQLRQTFRKLTERFSRIFLDGPAVNNYPESLLYAHVAQSILLVMAAGHARAPVVLSAVAKLPIDCRQRIEVVLNRRIYPIPQFLYEKLWSY